MILAKKSDKRTRRKGTCPKPRCAHISKGSNWADSIWKLHVTLYTLVLLSLKPLQLLIFNAVLATFLLSYQLLKSIEVKWREGEDIFQVWFLLYFLSLILLAKKIEFKLKIWCRCFLPLFLTLCLCPSSYSFW